MVMIKFAPSVTIYKIFAVKNIYHIWACLLEWAKAKCEYASRKLIDYFLFGGNRNVCHIFAIYEIFANEINRQILKPENKKKLKVKNEKNRTCSIRQQMFESILIIIFKNFIFPALYVYAKV